MHYQAIIYTKTHSHSYTFIYTANGASTACILMVVKIFCQWLGALHEAALVHYVQQPITQRTYYYNNYKNFDAIGHEQAYQAITYL